MYLREEAPLKKTAGQDCEARTVRWDAVGGRIDGIPIRQSSHSGRLATGRHALEPFLDFPHRAILDFPVSRRTLSA